jgi:hypothetical protein
MSLLPCQFVLNHVWDALLDSLPSTRPALALPLLLISTPITSVWPATCPAGGINRLRHASHALLHSFMIKSKTSVCALYPLLTSMPRMPVLAALLLESGIKRDCSVLLALLDSCMIWPVPAVSALLISLT